jgi:hypothetical protein
MNFQDTIEAMARSDCEFDGRNWGALSRGDKRRYLQRSFRGLIMAAQTAVDVEDFFGKVTAANLVGEERAVDSILKGTRFC